MKKTAFLSVTLIVFWISACQQPCPPLSDTQKSEIEKQVLTTWDQINIPIEKADAEGFLSYFSTNEFIAMFSGGNSFYSLKEYSDSVKTWFGPRKSTEITGKKIKVDVLSEEIALLDQTSVFQATFKDDRVIKVNHSVSFVFKKEADGWKIIHGHESMK